MGQINKALKIMNSKQKNIILDIRKAGNSGKVVNM